MIDCFWEMLSGFCPARFGLLFCSVVLGCRYTPKSFKLLDRSISGASFLTGDVFECDLAHRQFVAVLCMLYKIRCNPMYPIYGALPEPNVKVRVTRGAVIAHRYTNAPPRCINSQYRWTFSPLLLSLWNDLGEPVFDGVGLGGFKTRSISFLLVSIAPFLCPTVFPFSSFILLVGFVGWALRTDTVLIALSQLCITNHF